MRSIEQRLAILEDRVMPPTKTIVVAGQTAGKVEALISALEAQRSEQRPAWVIGVVTGVPEAGHS